MPTFHATTTSNILIFTADKQEELRLYVSVSIVPLCGNGDDDYDDVLPFVVKARQHTHLQFLQGTRATTSRSRDPLLKTLPPGTAAAMAFINASLCRNDTIIFTKSVVSFFQFHEVKYLK